MKSIVFLLCIALFGGCLTTNYVKNFDYKISSIEKNGSKERSTDAMFYEDSIIQISWYPSKTSFLFTLINKSDRSFQVIWDEAVMVTTTGESKKIFHSGVKYIDAEKSQAPTTLIKGSSISDLIIPSSNVNFSNGNWNEREFFYIKSSVHKSVIEAESSKYIGSIMSISLPIKQGDVKTEYVFDFKIKDAIIKKKANSKSISWIIVGLAAIIALTNIH